MNKYSYQESIIWMRSQPEYADLVKKCYLDEDTIAAAHRFLVSEEFIAVKRLLKLKELNNDLKIIDVGCGNGIASYAFASLGNHVDAVDPDSSQDVGLGAVNRLASVVQNGSILTHQSFAESLPFPDSYFDIVYARQSLHHFQNLSQGIKECARVLKPKGIFLATREHIVDNQIQLQDFLNNHLLHQMHGGENAYSVQEYLSAIKLANLKLIKHFQHFDIVINHFPESNTDIKNRLHQLLLKKIGNSISSKLDNNLWVENIFRYLLSRKNNFPGRLNSFLCVK